MSFDRPDYYQLTDDMDVLDLIRITQGDEVAKGFCIGNVFKYMVRAPEKGGRRDHIKALQYLRRLVEMEGAIDGA